MDTVTVLTIGAATFLISASISSIAFQFANEETRKTIARSNQIDRIVSLIMGTSALILSIF